MISADGHPVAGNIVFRVGAGAVDATAVPDSRRRHRSRIRLRHRPVRCLPGAGRQRRAVAVRAAGVARPCGVWPGTWCWHRWRCAAPARCCSSCSPGPYLSGGDLGDVVSSSKWSDVADTASVVGCWRRVVVSALLLAAVAVIPKAVSVGRAVVAATLRRAVRCTGGHGGGRWARWRRPVVGRSGRRRLGAHRRDGAVARRVGHVAVGHTRPAANALLDAVTDRWSRVAAGVRRTDRRRPEWCRPGACCLTSTLSAAGTDGCSWPRQAWWSACWCSATGDASCCAATVLPRPTIGRARSAWACSWSCGLALAVLMVTTVLVQTNPSGAADASCSGDRDLHHRGADEHGPRRSWKDPRTMVVTLDSNTVGRRRMTIAVDDDGAAVR